MVLEGDPECNNRDRYGRFLRYVYLQDGTLVKAEIVRQGYGFACTKYPFSLMEDLGKLEREARRKGRGMWGEGR